MARKVVLAGACRTAIGVMGGQFANTSAVELGTIVIKEALKRAGVSPDQVDEVYMGNVIQAGNGQNPARQAAVYAGIPNEVPATTINVLCGSGLHCVNLAAKLIAAGDADIIVAGGMENMTMAPYMLRNGRYGYRMGNATIEDAMIKDGLTDAFHNYHMGITAENICEQWGLTREELDEFSLNSQLKAEKAIKEGKNILLEGQLGSLKDPDHGIYPMVTSSSTLAAYGAIGAGIPPYEIKRIVTVVKAYSSAVGAGEFVSEILDEEEADKLRKHGGDGGEYGATTGRPRRMGWFDAVATRYGCRMQGATNVALTVLDPLGYLKEIPMCVGYEIDGVVTKDFPTTQKLEKAKPVYKVLPGWNCDIRGIRNYEDLPEACRNYIDTIEQEIQVPITLVSNGPGREEIIHRESKLQ